MIRATASDIEALRAALAVAEARAEEAVAKASNAEAIIAALKLMVEKLRREVYGQRSERKARLLDQLELELEELEARASEDELAAEQAAAKAERSAPLLAELEAWLRAERARLSRHAPVAKAMDYMLKRWPGFARFLEDGRVCLTNNAAERALRGIALGRKAWLFAGSDRGGHRAAFMYTLIVTAKINDVDPQAWLADVLARIADHSSQRLDELLPWNWKQAQAADTLAA